MGLFSKSERTCSHCGNTYKALVDLNNGLCNECYAESEAKKRELLASVRGYNSYNYRLNIQDYNGFELEPIVARKAKLVEKFRRPVMITRSEIMDAGENYKRLTDEQAEDILIRALASSINSTLGAAYAGNFFVLAGYDNVIVDVEDVFAVGFASDHKLNVGTDEAILCAIFTNDPYIPAFPMIYIGKTGFFELTKSKKGRKEVKEMFEAMCPNLTYPIDEIKILLKQVKKEGSVKGNIDKALMLKLLDNANYSSGVFETKSMQSELTVPTVNMLEDMGYLQRSELQILLKWDKLFNRKYWTKHMEKLDKKLEKM